jgi:hypothetical protein
MGSHTNNASPFKKKKQPAYRNIQNSLNKWRNCLSEITAHPTHHNGTIVQDLYIWKQKDFKFYGMEECAICYDAICDIKHQQCRMCNKLLHQTCLIKWFESSGKATCPLCRNLFSTAPPPALQTNALPIPGPPPLQPNMPQSESASQTSLAFTAFNPYAIPNFNFNNFTAPSNADDVFVFS